VNPSLTATTATEPRSTTMRVIDPLDLVILPSSYFDGGPDMETTRLSTKGQVIIPKAIREARNWQEGQQLEVTVTQDGVLLKARSPFPETKLEDVAGCLWRPGMKAKSDAEINRLLAKGIREAWNDDRH
jgi:AbrB family looped-hinge helix DNA binding protein